MVFDTIDTPYIQKLRDSLIEYVERHGSLRGAHVLEIGTGNGRFAFLLGHLVERWYGVDPNEDLLAMARSEMRQNRRIKHRRKVRFYKGKSPGKLPFKHKRFDIVFFSNSIHLLREPVDGLKEADVFLNPKGLLVVMQPTPREGRKFRNPKINPDSLRFDRDRYDKMLERLRFVENVLSEQEIFDKLDKKVDDDYSVWIFKKKL